MVLRKIRFKRGGNIEERLFDLENEYDREVVETWKAFGWTAEEVSEE